MEKEEEEKEEEELEEEEKDEHYTFNFSLNLHSLSFLALPGCLAILLLFILLLSERWCNMRKKRGAIENLDSVLVSGNGGRTEKKVKEENVEMKNPTINELSNRLPSYVEATQSLDHVVVVEKEKSLKENTKVEEETKGQRVAMKRQKLPDCNNLGSSASNNTNKVPQFSKSPADSTGPVKLETSQVFSIVTIRWPTAVDNFYEDVENPYGLARSNSFRLV